VERLGQAPELVHLQVGSFDDPREPFPGVFHGASLAKDLGHRGGQLLAYGVFLLAIDPEMMAHPVNVTVDEILCARKITLTGAERTPTRRPFTGSPRWRRRHPHHVATARFAGIAQLHVEQARVETQREGQ